MTEQNYIKDASVIDSNILVYIVDYTEKDKHVKAKKLLQDMTENISNYVICLQNLREFVFAVVMKKPNIKEKELLEYIQVFKNSVREVIYENEEDIEEAVKLHKNENIPYWDALIIATMKRHGIKTIYTENVKDFRKHKSIKAVNPLA